MSLLRAIQPVARRTIACSSSAAANRAPCARRFLNTETAPVLYTAHASVTGARNGHIESEGFTADLAMPKSLGGAGAKTNPEELFAAGYGACFQSAMAIGAKKVGVTLPTKQEDSVVETDVSLVGDMKAADLGIKVHMKIKVKGLSKEELEKVIAQTKEICPYSRATKGNVATTFEAIAL